MEMMQKPRIDRPEHYYEVALERMSEAWMLYKQEEGRSYALAMYVAGVAVECMLRAFKLLRDRAFDERHDLERLFKSSGLITSEFDLREKGMPEDQAKAYVKEMVAARNQICRLWANEYRFTSEALLRAHLKRMQLDRGVKGDYLKKGAGDLLTAAQAFIEKGVFQWRLSRRSAPS